MNAAHAACGTRPFSAWQDGEPPPAQVRRLVEHATIEPYVSSGPPGGAYWEGNAPCSVTVVTSTQTYDANSQSLMRLSEGELVAKFIANVAPVAGEAKARELADMSLHLEDLPRAASLMDLCTSPN